MCMTLRLGMLLAVLLALGLPLSTAANSQNIVLLTDDGPPHMVREFDGGIDIDITRQVLESAGYSVTVIYAPLARAKKMILNKEADITVPTFFQEDTEGYYVSEPFIEYRPTIFTLQRKQLSIEDINALSSFRVMTFQGATGYFGPEFAKLEGTPRYTEMHDMSVLPSMLFKDRTDIVVLDYYIFHYFARLMIPEYHKALVEGHGLIPRVPAYAAFHDKSLRDAFNKQLKVFQLTNRQEEIIQRYIGTNLSEAVTQNEAPVKMTDTDIN